MLKRSLLIVDDEEAILFAYSDFLSDPTTTISTAKSYLETIELVNTTTFDGALVDLRLGGTDNTEGFDIIRTLRARNPQCKIVLLTAHAEAGTDKRAYSEGADIFLEKPASPAQVHRLFTTLGVL